MIVPLGIEEDSLKSGEEIEEVDGWLDVEVRKRPWPARGPRLDGPGVRVKGLLMKQAI